MAWPVIVVPYIKADGMAVFPFIIVRTAALKNDQVLIRHEAIHLRQAIELLVIPFYLLYLVNYLIGLLKYKKHHAAYMNIVFEREAYAREHDLEYLKHRGVWNWRRYL
jgi:hypothetical protein